MTREIRPAPPNETRKCVICERPFHCRPNEWAHIFRQRRTCGRECGHLLAARTRTYLRTKRCAQCGKAFKPREASNKYCSLQCYWESKQGSQGHIPDGSRVTLTCIQCDTLFSTTRYNAKHGRRFCSRTCYYSYMSNAGDPNHIARNTTNAFYLSKAWTQTKRRIRRRDNYTCQRCKRKLTRTSKGLRVHHIQARSVFVKARDSLDAQADIDANLITLCTPCHGKVHSGLPLTE